MVADRLRQDPDFVTRFAMQNLDRWREHGVDCADHRLWRKLLLGEPGKLVSMLIETTEEAIRLRQSSPFAGLIPESDRRRILETVE